MLVVVQDKVFETYASIPGKILTSGQKTDIVFHQIRVAFFHSDYVKAKEKLGEAKKCAPSVVIAICWLLWRASCDPRVGFSQACGGRWRLGSPQPFEGVPCGVLHGNA